MDNEAKCRDCDSQIQTPGPERMTVMALLNGMAFRSGRHSVRMARLADWLVCQDIPEDIEAILYELVQDSWW